MDVTVDNSIDAVDNTLVADVETPTISKNQRKRLLREQHRKESKKAKKELKRSLKAAQRAECEEKKESVGDLPFPTTAGETESLDTEIVKTQIANRKARKQEELAAYIANCKSNFSVIIDCGWEDKHTESSLKSLTQQIMFSYGYNRRHSNPCSIYLTGLGPLVTAKLSKLNFEQWVGVSSSSEDYINSNAFHTSTSLAVDPPANSGGGGSPVTGRKELVYLTSDATETLTKLDSNCAYIIGGIVDRNRHKGVTFKKAVAQGVRTAKLPIKENFSLAATHVLTVNHVFAILLNYSKCRSWANAIEEVLPQRKGATNIATQPASIHIAKEKQQMSDVTDPPRENSNDP